MKKKFAKITKLILFFLIIATVCYGGYKAWQAYQEYLRQEMTQTLTIDGEEFSFQKLSEMARKLSQSAYVAPAETLPESLKKLDYDQHRDIRFARDNGPWFGKKLPFEIQFFHLGSLFQVSVPINEVINGKTRPIKYSSNYFDYGKNKFNTEEFKNIGYAGFRLHTPLNTSSYYDELISFLGASYFRALAQDQKYGISARGLAIDTAVQTGEEFPIFREFWIERPTRRADSATIYALLDSPSIAGAYKFVVTPGKTTVMNVESLLYPRKKINKLGIAPLTSMFLFGENTKNRFDDHRPEVHDSDGLLIQNGAGEWLWRPLDNSKYLRISSFVDNNPKGFGLLQRDKNPEHYLDFEAYYEQRPSVWVEPTGDWGKGSVELVEIPSVQEIHDNVVAYWVPKKSPEPNEELSYKYKLYWFNDFPVEKHPGSITATYTGIGGVSGMLETNKRKFAIDFDILNMKSEVEKGIATIDASASEGKIVGKHLVYNPLTRGVTAYVDFEPNGKTSELRISIVKKGKAISEVWSYQWLP
jgi:periplasmic glucan biosynthesis protein mdoG